MEMQIRVLERFMEGPRKVGHRKMPNVAGLVQGSSLSICRKEATRDLMKRLGNGYIIRQMAFVSHDLLEAIVEPVGGPVRPQGAQPNVKHQRGGPSF